MQGYISIEIPTKPYIKAYVHHRMGAKPLMTADCNSIGHKLYDLLQHDTNEFGSRKLNSMYTCKMRVYIPIATFHHRGANLNITNLKNFNRYIERKIKDRFYELMDEGLEVLNNFNSNLPEVRRKLGIDLEAWSDDSMKKDYYRYRQKMKAPKNISAAYVP